MPYELSHTEWVQFVTVGRGKLFLRDRFLQWLEAQADRT
jgi:hypothetical protein